jgi:glycosyltransferase involved in cell wall biosynthesis
MISVILPVYNAENFLALAVESILQQTFQDFELIVVDDGSTDNSLEVLKPYLSNSKVRLVKGQHGGLSRALNLGITEAQYEWIARMDADDIALPERFQRQVEAILSQPQVVAWGTYAYHISATGKKLGLARSGPITAEEFYSVRNEGHLVQLIHPTVMLKKEAVIASGGYRSELEPVEELDLFDRMAAYGPTLVIPEPLLLYRVHSQSVSMQRFFFQRILMRYVSARHRRTLAEQPEQTLEEFIQEYHQKPWFSRLSRSLKTSGMFCYRKAGLSMGDGYYIQAGLYLGLSMILNPSYSLNRFKQQVVSAQIKEK